jgi:hypothetical protein
MAAKRTFTDAAATELTIGLIEKGVQIFLRNRREHPNHDRETCYLETIEEVRAAYQAGETDTRRNPGS